MKRQAMKLKNELNSDVLAVLIRDMASEFIKSRSPAGEGVGAYVDKRYPMMTAEQRAEKEKQVIGRCELAQNIKGLAGEIAAEFESRILELGIPYYFHGGEASNE